MTMAAKAIPIRLSILKEHKGGRVTTTIWHTEDIGQEQVGKAVTLGEELYTQLTEPKSEQAIPRFESIDYIALPMIAYPPRIFGVLLLQASGRFNENDLAFADAITNLIAISLDRYYSANDLKEFQEKFIANLEAERDLRESFVSTLTHDLRNSLGTTKLNAGVISKSSDHQICQKMSQKIISSIERVDYMIENLLDANRIHAGEKLPLKIEGFDLHDMLKTVVNELSEVSGGQIALTDDQEVPGYWSRNGIRRAVENLISNALKYGSPDRPVSVSLKRNPESVQIAVYNEGNPIPPEELGSLFQMHKRAESAQASAIRGWGLGLTLVRGMVEAHGGSVKAESSPEKGTTFTMILPRDCRRYEQHDMK